MLVKKKPVYIRLHVNQANIFNNHIGAEFLENLWKMFDEKLTDPLVYGVFDCVLSQLQKNKNKLIL